eukprot:962953-Pyramimonas_sp.AAC.2
MLCSAQRGAQKSTTLHATDWESRHAEEHCGKHTCCVPLTRTAVCPSQVALPCMATTSPPGSACPPPCPMLRSKVHPCSASLLLSLVVAAATYTPPPNSVARLAVRMVPSSIAIPYNRYRPPPWRCALLCLKVHAVRTTVERSKNSAPPRPYNDPLVSGSEKGTATASFELKLHWDTATCTARWAYTAPPLAAVLPMNVLDTSCTIGSSLRLPSR